MLTVSSRSSLLRFEIGLGVVDAGWEELKVGTLKVGSSQEKV
jgi:hypothetical protein